MKNQNTNKTFPFPARLLTGALMFTGIILGALAWSGVDSNRRIAALYRHDLRIEELRGTILHLDEVLTMSARMAAATGDSNWEQRYRQFEPQLDTAIKEAMELTAHSDSGRAAAQTDAANLKLVEMENQSFALVRAGEAGRAKAVLFSDEYEAQKEIYAGGMLTLIQHLKEQLTADQRQKQREAFFSFIAVAVCIVLLLFTWFSVLRSLNSWRTIQSASLDLVTGTEEELRKLNDGLEKRVKDRTRSLQLEIQERKEAEAALQQAQKIAHVGSWALDVAHETEIWSDEQFRLFGFTPGASTPGHSSILSLVHPDDQKAFANRNPALLVTKKSAEMEFRIILSSGEVRILQSRADVVLDDSGHVLRLVGTSQDITGRKRIDEMLREQAQLAALESEVGVALMQGESLPEMLQWCSEAVVSHLDAAFARIWTLNEKENMLELQASAGLYTHLNGAHGRVPVGKFKIGLIAEERKPHLTNQVVGDPRVGEQDWAKREGMVAFAGYPLIVENRVVGVVAMFARHTLSDVVLQGLASIANNLAAIIVRQRTEEALRESEEHFRFLNNLTEATRTLADPEQIMAAMSRMLGEHLRASRCAYADVEKNGEQFTILHDYTDGCASTIGNYHLSLFGAQAVATLNGGQTLIIRDVEAELLPAEGADMFNAIGIKAIITCPLVKDGTLRAMMAVHQTTPRDWKPGEVAIVQEVVERCWATIERRTAEAEVQQSQKRMRDLLDGLAPSIFVGLLTPQGILIEINQSPLTAAGLKPEDVLGKPFDETPWWSQSLDAQRQLREAMARAARGEASRYDVRTHGVGNQVIDIDFSLQPLRDETGEVVFLIPSASVITERKRAERALRASETEFRALAEAMPQMVWITRPDGWNIYFSQQWMDYTGLTLEESLGHGWNKPFHPEDQQRAWDAWHQATSTNGVYSIECRLRRADGVYRWWLVRGVPQQDTVGNIHKWFGTCTDIHDLKLAELEISRTNQALSDSDEKFHQLADNISDVFWITSPDLKTLHYMSPGYELIWGRSQESLYAHSNLWLESILPEERESVFAVFATLMGTAPEVSVEYRIARPDGTVRWIQDRAFQVRDAAGKLVRITGIATDITESKNLEAQLRQSQKMEAIGTLAGGIAHDFNNILAAITGYSEMAQRGISRDSRAQAHLDQVLIASNRGRDLVLQILAFSRQAEPEREAVALQPIIEETLKLLRVSLPSKVDIHQDIDPTTPSVLGDATQIQQVTMNLCVNAGQAMKERGGIIEVRLTGIDVDHDLARAHPELKEGPHVCLTVSDTGCGMERAMQERIFEPFFTTKAPGEGTGLGLAVVHGVIKNHSGAIVVSSELGVGTTFSVYLPVYDGPQAPIIHKSFSLPQGNGEHILFVDDENALVSLGKSMLEHLGYRVTTMNDSIEALAAFKSQPEDFDLVITDQRMPRLNGADFATALLEIRPALPVILVTGYNTAITREKAKAIGIGELLFKPNTMQALGEAIHRALGEGR